MMLAKKIFNLKSFQRQYEALYILSICNTIENLKWSENRTDLLAKIDWNNMLGIASILSYSDDSDHLEAALRIAQTCLEIEELSETQKNASAIILDNLTNKPSIKIAIDKQFLKTDYKSNYPIMLRLQSIKSEIENSILLNDKVLNLNKFQKSVYDVYEDNSTMSISAPTSAGKSFILYTIIAEELSQKIMNVIYIVPTRALISQVESDLRDYFKNYSLQNVNISTVPQNEITPNQSNVFVFTQERLHWFLIENKSFDLNLFVIDEAHKIEDGNRGILLQQKIEDVASLFPNAKILFSSPFTSNPEIFFDSVQNAQNKDIVNTLFTSVNQNLIFCKQIRGNTNEWELILPFCDKSIVIGKIKLKDRATSEIKKISLIVQAISNTNSGNLIYANGAAEAEKESLVLYDLCSEITSSEQIMELIKLVKKTIHKDYLLAKVLEKKIAFHYGNMPLLIRQEIEKLFKNGEIRYLICTSTLLEGVNLPAKSIFIRKPTRGRDHPLDSNDFWNLAGRAGRWGVEFSGNIVCVEPEKWEIKPSNKKKKQIIKKAIDGIEAEGDQLISYIKAGCPRKDAEKRQDWESAVGYFYIKYLDECLPNDSDFYMELKTEFDKFRTIINIPDYIIKRNPGISPLAQQNLFEYLQTKNMDEIERLIPVYPENEDAVNEYAKLIGRIGKTLSAYPYQLNYSRAILLVNWMKGQPLSALISSSEKSYKRKGNPKKLPTIIRETMDQVENFARFRFARDSNCYIDVLRYFFEVNSKSELIASIPQLNLWLEFGVNQKTHLSLLSIGLSRNTVIELSQYITNSQMSKEECLKWLKEQDLIQLEISPIIVEDIKRVL